MAGEALSSRGAGTRGEQIAAELLRRDGYEILAANYHSVHGEIDLIAAGEGCLCFVEVKPRRSKSLVSGEAAVGPAKRRRIIRTALCWLQDHPTDLQPRFDVIVLETDRDGAVRHSEHYKGAFDGEGN